MQADPTQRALADRCTYYYHATRMSPAELKAWMQAKGRADTLAEPPAQVTAPGRPTEPSGQPALARRLARYPYDESRIGCGRLFAFTLVACALVCSNQLTGAT